MRKMDSADEIIGGGDRVDAAYRRIIPFNRGANVSSNRIESNRIESKGENWIGSDRLDDSPAACGGYSIMRYWILFVQGEC